MTLTHRLLSVPSLHALAFVLACDAPEPPIEDEIERDSAAERDGDDPGGPNDETEGAPTSGDTVPCETLEASRECTAESGSAGVQFCDDTEVGRIWGPCLESVDCTPGQIEDCGFCNEGGESGGETDGEWECEFEGLSDSCVLSEGVPTWGCQLNDDCDCNTPLVLSFDAAPVQMSAAPMATFDIDGIGACITTDWPAASTPWLALDVDGNGIIDSGRELFGSGTRLQGNRRARNGFSALAALDSDGNGRIDGSDERFDELVLWSDHDGDKRGVFGEMESLAMRHIVSIDLGYSVDRECDDRGNCSVERSSFVYVDGTGNLAQGEVVDIHLACQ